MMFQQQTSSWNIWWLFLIGFYVISCCDAYGYHASPHIRMQWSCEGCTSESHRLNIVGAIHRALYAEVRAVYYAFNYEWMDAMLRSSSSARIIEIDRNILSDYRPVRMMEYEIIHVHFPRSTFSPPGSNTYMERHSQQLDNFLTHNPCWVPLHEPCAFNCSHFVFHTEEMQFYGESAILIRLPGMYNDTCKFLEALVHRQFPQQCIYDEKHMRIGHPHNIGWSNTVHTVQAWLQDTLKAGHTKMVLVLPRGHSFDGQHQDFPLENGTMYHRDRSRWYWASHQTCPLDTILFDPWACNFLSLTNCSSRNSVLNFLENGKDVSEVIINKVGYFGSHSGFLDEIGVTDKTRAAIGDSPYLHTQAWLNTRMLAFLQRGNARLRQMNRKSYKNIVRLHSHNTVPKQHDTRAPCVALHVRHGDAIKLEEWRKDDKKTDRSFEAHVVELKRTLKAMGTNVVFLMTDNSTLSRVAPQMYPEITWLMQRRPIKEHTVMYRVNNEDDIQLELSHLLVDVRMAGSCAALVGCFDSGVTVQVGDNAHLQSFDGLGMEGFRISVESNRANQLKVPKEELGY